MSLCIGINAGQQVLGPAHIEPRLLQRQSLQIDIDQRPGGTGIVRFLRQFLDLARGNRDGLAVFQHPFQMEDDGFSRVGQRLLDGLAGREAARNVRYGHTVE